MKNQIFRFNLLLSTSNMNDINNFFEAKTNSLEPITINKTFNLKDKYKIIATITGLSIGDYHCFCFIETTIMKNGSTFLKDRFTAYSLSEFCKILNVESSDGNTYLIKIDEDTLDLEKTISRTYNSLKYKINHDEEALINQLMYKSFSDKMQGMELCFALLVSHEHLYNKTQVNDILINTLNFLGYDEDFYKMIKEKEGSIIISSKDVYESTIYLILDCLYRKNVMDKKQSKYMAIKYVNHFLYYLFKENTISFMEIS